jgi:hypothetical protein
MGRGDGSRERKWGRVRTAKTVSQRYAPLNIKGGVPIVQALIPTSVAHGSIQLVHSFASILTIFYHHAPCTPD